MSFRPGGAQSPLPPPPPPPPIFVAKCSAVPWRGDAWGAGLFFSSLAVSPQPMTTMRDSSVPSRGGEWRGHNARFRVVGGFDVLVLSE